MNILIAYYSKTGSTETVAAALEQQLLKKGNDVSIAKILPVEDLKAYQYKKNDKAVRLKGKLPELKSFDLVLVGTPVWGFCPTPIIVSYLQGLKNTTGKKFALFATCTALPGTTIQRMGSILTTKGAKVLTSLTIRSVFELDETKLGQAREFADSLGKSLL